MINHLASMARRACVALAAAALVGFQAGAACALPLIRDAEIEHTLRLFCDPVLEASGLNPASTRLFIVNDDAINAFVAGGANMFIFSGLILASETPDMLIGVMAHEAGHIAGGHLARGGEKLKDAQLGTIISAVVGAAAAAASGKPEAAAAVISGGQNAMMRNFLAFTRAHEEAADQSALRTLDKLGISAQGMLKTFQLLQRNERMRGGKPDPYMVSHPLNAARIDHVRNHIEQSKIKPGTYPKSFDAAHRRMVAKLFAFMESPERTFQKYPRSDASVPARMARAIAYFKMPDLTRSLAEMDALIADYPEDAFLYDLKGQILFESNRPREALQAYETANRLLRDNALILNELGKVELAQASPDLARATQHLERSSVLDRTNPQTWRLLATAYGRQKDLTLSNIALAEEALLLDNPEQALARINQALAALTSPSATRQRALDIKDAAMMLKKEKDDR
jgi:predicted Zn-dependent protease